MGWLAVSIAHQIEMEHDNVEIIQSGSVFKAGELITKPMCELILQHCPKARLIPLEGPPVVGPVILGMEQAGFDDYVIRAKIMQTAKTLFLIKGHFTMGAAIHFVVQTLNDKF